MDGTDQEDRVPSHEGPDPRRAGQGNRSAAQHSSTGYHSRASENPTDPEEIEKVAGVGFTDTEPKSPAGSGESRTGAEYGDDRTTQAHGRWRPVARHLARAAGGRHPADGDSELAGAYVQLLRNALERMDAELLKTDEQGVPAHRGRGGRDCGGR